MFARALIGLAAGFLLATSAVFVTAGWRSGLGCLTCGVVGAVLGFDVDRVTRKSRWQARDAERAARALRDAQNRGVPIVSLGMWTSLQPIDYVHDPGHHNTLLDGA